MIKIKGELENFLEEVEEYSKKLSEFIRKSTPITELLTEQFFAKYSNFQSIGEFFESGGFDFKTAKDFQKYPKKKFDIHVKNNSQFNSWQEMITKAQQEYLERTLPFPKFNPKIH